MYPRSPAATTASSPSTGSADSLSRFTHASFGIQSRRRGTHSNAASSPPVLGVPTAECSFPAPPGPGVRMPSSNVWRTFSSRPSYTTSCFERFRGASGRVRRGLLRSLFRRDLKVEPYAGRGWGVNLACEAKDFSPRKVHGDGVFGLGGVLAHASPRLAFLAPDMHALQRHKQAGSRRPFPA